MCCTANLFDTNIRKFANFFMLKKRFFFFAQNAEDCKSSFSLRTKLVYLRLKFSCKSKAPNLRQPKLSTSYKESVCSSLGVDFSHKNGGVGTIC